MIVTFQYERKEDIIEHTNAKRHVLDALQGNNVQIDRIMSKSTRPYDRFLSLWTHFYQFEHYLSIRTCQFGHCFLVVTSRQPINHYVTQTQASQQPSDIIGPVTLNTRKQCSVISLGLFVIIISQGPRPNKLQK